MLIKRLRSIIFMFFPFLFLIGYFMTAYRMEKNGIEYFFLTVLSMIVCWLLLFQIYKPITFSLPIWIMFSYFIIAYYLKFYWLVLNPNFAFQRSYLLLQVIDSEEILISTYRIVTYSFVGFCAIAWIFLNKIKTKKIDLVFQRIDSDKIIYWKQLNLFILPLVFILIFFSNYLMYSKNIAIMGAKSVYLPFRLAGIIFYTNAVIIPGILIFLCWLNYQKKTRIYFLLSISLLILHGLAQTLIRTSKGVIIGILICIIFLLIIERIKFSKGKLLFFGISILLIFILYPIISNYRWIRVVNPKAGLFSGISKSIMILISNSDGGFGNIFVNTFNSMFHRLTGVESLMMIISKGFNPLGIGALKNFSIFGGCGIAKIFTIEVEGIPEYIVHNSATSFLGWFYMVGGYWFAIFGTIFFISIIWIVWLWILKANLKCKPIALILYLSMLVGWILDGCLDTIFNWGTLSTIAVIICCELLLRTLGRESLIYNNKYIKKRVE